MYSGVDKEEDKTSDDGLLEPGDDYELEDLSKPKKRIYEDDPDSPAAIVRKVVAETDDPTMTTLTFRVILLGTMLCILGGKTVWEVRTSEAHEICSCNLATLLLQQVLVKLNFGEC